MRVSPHLRLHNDALSHQAKQGVTPIAKPERREKTPSRLKRTEMKRGSSNLKRGSCGRTTDAQKERVAGGACVVCRGYAGECHPAHVVPRSHPKMTEAAANDVRAVVPLCFVDHRLFDEGQIDLLSYLEPGWRDSQEWAAGAVGLATAMRSITGGAA
jgi:hypothetical protein